ncbi:hypothetical protein CALCODRAFT_505278 [Calocera cornea HHB12733]|uniref:DUF6593 domain-containing protein n=1 Tax=Calocera cornea HHB12733 TaxID=1353952 RepID=A0A165K9P7_9BASI|nr:hypothetical protein CALCODRAFT_505278 [Calocera cornea HHB12733]
MAHLWHRRAGESQQKLQPDTSAIVNDPNFLHFSVSHGDPLAMSFTQKGGDLLYKCTTASHVSSITCQSGGGSRDVAKIRWNNYDIGTIMVEFLSQEPKHIEDFLKFVKDTGLEHRFNAKGRTLHGSFASDHFVLTDPDDTLLGHDNRVPAGLFRRPTPDSFDVSADLLDLLDYIFVAYLCMERARRERSAGIQSRAYSERWGPGTLGGQSAWGLAG